MRTKKLVFCFAFLSVCTTLPLVKIGSTSESKINHDLFCASLGLHYSALGEDRQHLGIKNKSRFILCFSRFALSLQRERVTEM